MKNHLFSTKRVCSGGAKGAQWGGCSAAWCLAGDHVPWRNATFCAWNDGKSLWQFLCFLVVVKKLLCFKDFDVSWWFSILWLLLPLRILNDDWFVWMISLRRFMDFSWRWLAFMGKARIRPSISELHIQIYHIQFVPHGPRDAKELRIELSNQLFVR